MSATTAELARRVARVDQLIVRMVARRAQLAARLAAERVATDHPERDLAAELATFHRYRADLGADGATLAMIIVNHQPRERP
jgi:chorismate mutase